MFVVVFSLSQAKLALPGVHLTVLLLSKVEATLNYLALLVIRSGWGFGNFYDHVVIP